MIKKIIRYLRIKVKELCIIPERKTAFFASLISFLDVAVCKVYRRNIFIEMMISYKKSSEKIIRWIGIRRVEKVFSSLFIKLSQYKIQSLLRGYMILKLFCIDEKFPARVIKVGAIYSDGEN